MARSANKRQCPSKIWIYSWRVPSRDGPVGARCVEPAWSEDLGCWKGWLRPDQDRVTVFPFFPNDELKTNCEQCHKSIQFCNPNKPSLSKRSGKSGAHRQQGRTSQWATPPTNLKNTGRKRQRATEITVCATPMQLSGTWCVEHREPWKLPSFRRTGGPLRSIFLPSQGRPQQGDICHPARAQRTSSLSPPAREHTVPSILPAPGCAVPSAVSAPECDIHCQLGAEEQWEP